MSSDSSSDVTRFVFVYLAACLGRKKACHCFFTDVFFPRARAKGSCCLRLPQGVWIKLRRMPDQASRMPKRNKNIMFFFSIFNMEASKPMFFQCGSPKASSFKKQRFFTGFGVGPGPDPARARPRPGTGLGGAEPGLGGSPGITWLSQASQETFMVLALGAALCAASTVEGAALAPTSGP